MDPLKVLSRGRTGSYLHFIKVPLEELGKPACSRVESEVERQGRRSYSHPGETLMRPGPEAGYVGWL